MSSDNKKLVQKTLFSSEARSVSALLRSRKPTFSRADNSYFARLASILLFAFARMLSCAAILLESDCNSGMAS